MKGVQMSKRIYLLEQLKALRGNSNVAKCSSKSITYSKEFKLKAVKAYYEEGQSPRMEHGVKSEFLSAPS